MKPNLKSFSILEIDLSGKVELTDDIMQRIKKASPPDEDGDSVFYDTYKVGNSSHVGWAIISAPAKDGKTCHFSLHYELGRARKTRKKLPLIDEVLNILSNVDSSIELACFSRCEFTKRDKATTILNLPLLLSESPVLPFDEVRGLHLAKVEGKQSKYDVVLDRGRDGSLTETVVFRYTTRINDSLVNEIVKKAVEISERFVFKEK